MLAKMTDGSDPLDLLRVVLPIYGQVLKVLAAARASWVQLNEPVPALDLTEQAKIALGLADGTLAAQSTTRRIAYPLTPPMVRPATM
jgi:5-methyltetrahydropteroyltriglutamate--homocysteine methyltransferase